MRFVQLIFSPTGGVKRAAGLLSAPMAEQPDIIDLSLPLNGTPRFSPEDVCLIAVPCFGGRVPEIALERLAPSLSTASSPPSPPDGRKRKTRADWRSAAASCATG